MADERTFYVRFRGRCTGPHALDEIMRMVGRGQVSRMHQVSDDGAQWRRATDVPALRAAFGAGAADEGAVDASDGDRSPIDSPDRATEARATPTWYYSLDNKSIGPVPARVLKTMVEQGRLEPGTLVWHEGLDEWVPLAEAGILPPAVDPTSRPELGTTALADAQSRRPIEEPGTSDDQADPRPAGFWLRACAGLLDRLLLTVMYMVSLFIILLRAEDFNVEVLDTNAIRITFVVLEVLLYWLYAATLESSPLQATLGKRALCLYVTGARQERLSFARATFRHFAKLISALLLGAGFIMIGFTRKKQGLHDILAETLVQRR